MSGLCLCIAGGEQGRLAKAGRQQDRVRSAGLRAGHGSELRARARPVSRRQDLQGLYVQLCTQVHEHRYTAGQRPLSTFLQGSLRDRPKKVSMQLRRSLSSYV